MSGAAGPLAGIRVLELGQVIAGPYCAQLLGDLGADVVKLEPPRAGDVLRQWGWREGDGDSLWWKVAARNKRSVTVDLRHVRGQEIARRLADQSDIVVENFRPGTLERWGLGYDELARTNPGLIMVRISGFGQTGPYAHRAGYAAVGEAMGGLRRLIGFADRPPPRAGVSLGDSLTGIMGAVGALAALHPRGQTGRGQVIDASIYESVLSITEALVPEWRRAGIRRARTGTTLPGIAPSNIYPTADGEILIAANQDTVFRRLATLMDQDGLADDPRFRDHRSRGENMAELDATVGEWTRQAATSALLEQLAEAGVPAGRLYEPQDMVTDPHFIARESLVEVPDGDGDPVLMPRPFPRFSATPTEVRWPGPELGADTGDILRSLGLDQCEIEELRAEGVV